MAALLLYLKYGAGVIMSLLSKVRIILERKKQKLVSNYGSDATIVEEMLRPYRDKKYNDVPPDPRLIDPSRIAALRERLASQYSYRWRDLEANNEIAEAVFAGRRSKNDGLIRLIYNSALENNQGHGPPLTVSPISWKETDRYFRKYYISVAISSVRRYIDDLGDAEHLLRSVYPSCGYTMMYGAAGRRVRLECDGEIGPWIDAGSAARSLIIATFERLERHPEQAAAWREP
ncbi:hypothetical protein PUR29_30400 [Methylobacterium ajmalii]|uniref:Uncharacterized protein n=1 Tax=Methylobacterium ajmalii TaxID=2738439 RepID=A0ABV0A4H8_9HYPH